MFGLETLIFSHTVDYNAHVIIQDKPPIVLTEKVEDKHVEKLIASKISNITVTNEEVIEKPKNISLAIYFKFNKYGVAQKQSTKTQLQDIDFSKVDTVQIDGFASKPGTKKYNLKLSDKRIESVIALIRSYGYTGEFSRTAHGEDCQIQQEHSSNHKLTKQEKGKLCQKVDIQIIFQ